MCVNESVRHRHSDGNPGGKPGYAERIANVPLLEQAAPIVTVEEIIRGRLNAIRQAEAAKAVGCHSGVVNYVVHEAQLYARKMDHQS